MIVNNCEFNPEKDIKEVDQFGFVDLRESFVNSSIPANLDVQGQNFNNIEDPSMVRHRPSDVFDSLRAEKAYAGIVFNEEQKQKSATQTGAN